MAAGGYGEQLDLSVGFLERGGEGGDGFAGDVVVVAGGEEHCRAFKLCEVAVGGDALEKIHGAALQLVELRAGALEAVFKVARWGEGDAGGDARVVLGDLQRGGGGGAVTNGV